MDICSLVVSVISCARTLLMFVVFFIFYSLEKEILDRYLEVVLKGNKDGLKVRS